MRILIYLPVNIQSISKYEIRNELLFASIFIIKCEKIEILRVESECQAYHIN